MRIVNREQTILSLAERKVLAKVRLKKTLILLVAYGALIAVLVTVYLTGMIKSSETSLEKIQRIRRATLILTGSSFIIFTCFFIRHYYKSVYPYTRDLKNGMKTVSWFYPVSYKTPFFDNFFLKTGSPKNPMLAIPKNLYEAIQPGMLAFIAFAPKSRFVLMLDINGEQVEYNEVNSDLEL